MVKLINQHLGIKISVIVNTLLSVVMVAGTAYLIRQQSASLQEQFLEKAKIESIIGAKAVSRILEEAIENNILSIEAVFDTRYIPIPNTDPPKYHTKYDDYLDGTILAFEDEFLKDKNVIFAVAVDINGYLPTHNTIFQRPLTGDKVTDVVGNRTKRIFNDGVGLQAAQNLQDGFLQEYRRDTGEILWDVSSPIFVKGKHWGGFRIGFSLNAVNEAKKRLAISLITIMIILLLVSTWGIFFMINQALRPMVEFTKIASNLADGNVEQKIIPRTNDEIGQLADVLERLRVSLKAAMERLQRR